MLLFLGVESYTHLDSVIPIGVSRLAHSLNPENRDKLILVSKILALLGRSTLSLHLKIHCYLDSSKYPISQVVPPRELWWLIFYYQLDWHEKHLKLVKPISGFVRDVFSERMTTGGKTHLEYKWPHPIGWEPGYKAVEGELFCSVLLSSPWWTEVEAKINIFLLLNDFSQEFSTVIKSLSNIENQYQRSRVVAVTT